MRFPTLILCAGLLLGGCAEAGSRADNVADANDGATAVGGGPAEPRQPADGSRAAEASVEVSLSAAPVEAAEGATITLMLSNGSDERIGYNLCASELQTGDGRPVPTANVCTMELRTLEPGATADHRYKLPLNMPDGSYRFLTRVEWMHSGRRSGIPSNSFEVR